MVELSDAEKAHGPVVYGTVCYAGCSKATLRSGVKPNRNVPLHPKNFEVH